MSQDSNNGRRRKSEEAFRTISEVAGDLDVPQHVLRFWETKFPAIQPLKRGGGRRYYRPDDIALLRRIRTLLYDEGYTIKGVQKLLEGNGGRLPESAFVHHGGMSPERRRALETVLDELVSLRDILQDAGGSGTRPRNEPESATAEEVTVASGNAGS